jgi:hypothetical protein
MQKNLHRHRDTILLNPVLMAQAITLPTLCAKPRLSVSARAGLERESGY